MCTAIVLENKEVRRNLLSNYLKENCPRILLKASVVDVEDAIQAIHSHHPDVLFMDLHLKSETCFDLLQRLDYFTFSIIFITTGTSCAFQVLRVSAEDYFLKTIKIVDLMETPDKLKKNKNLELINRKPETQMTSLSAFPWEPIIIIPFGGSFDIIKVTDIIYLEAHGTYTHFLLKQGIKKIASKNIGEYEGPLRRCNFYRIHNSYIINIAELSKYYRKNEWWFALMSNKVVLEVSRRRLNGFIRFLDQLKVI